MIFAILHAIKPLGCSVVVWIILTFYSHKVIKISVIVAEIFSK
jgi:hypothetical protein